MLPDLVNKERELLLLVNFILLLYMHINILKIERKTAKLNYKFSFIFCSLNFSSMVKPTASSLLSYYNKLKSVRTQREIKNSTLYF